MEQMKRKEDENSRLLKLILDQKKSPKQADLIDFFSQDATPHPVPQEINLIPLQTDPSPVAPPNVDPNQIPSRMPTIPSSETPNHPNHPTTQHQPLPTALTAQENLLQQLITVSQHQTKVLSDKTESGNISELRFPKFTGKSTEFDGWYNQILSILSTPKWSMLYNFETQNIVAESEAPSHASQNLYSKLVLCLSDDAEQVMRTKHHLRGKGITFLQNIKSTFKRTLTSTELMKIESDFARPQRKHNETITSFAARCIHTRKELQDHGIDISDDRLAYRFIHGLGPMFTDVRTNLKNMPNWQTNDMDKLILEATDHENTVLAIREHNKLFKRQPKTEPSSNKDQTQLAKDAKRKADITKAIESGKFDPAKFASQVKPNNCVFHNTSHATTSCDHIGALVQNHPQQTYKHGKYPRFSLPQNNGNANQPSARQVLVEPIVEDIDLKELTIEEDNLKQLESILNNNNESVNPYKISCNNVTIDPSHKIMEPHQLTFVVDSGAYPHMCNTLAVFSQFQERLLPGQERGVVLADGVTTAPIKGSGSIEFKIKDNMFRLNNVLYVPALSSSLFSIKQHCQYKGCYFHSENNIATLAFPSFTTTFPIKDELYLHTTPIIHEQIHKMSPSNEQLNFPINCKQVTPHTISDSKPSPSTAILKYKILYQDGKPPIRATPSSAGLDIHSSVDIILPPKTRAKIPTGIAVEIPNGCYGRVAPRSGLTLQGIDIGAGVIDPDYRGEVTPVLLNNSSAPFTIKKGDRVAQLILEKYSLSSLQEIAHMSETLRGEKGFGSTSELTSSSPTHHTNLKMNQLKFNKKITIKLPSYDYFSKGRIQINADNDYVFQPTDTTMKYILSPTQIRSLLQSNRLKFGHNHLITVPNKNDTTANEFSNAPPTRVVDTPILNAPKKAMYSIDQIKRGFGFRNVQSIIKELKQTSSNFGISTLDSEPILDLGETTTIDRVQRNTTPLSLPIHPGSIVHADILFGSGTAIGGAKYALFLVDRTSRHKYIYPLHNLKEDILPAFITFFSDIGRVPSLIRTDFDHKLMGKTVQHHLEKNNCKLQSAPPDMQSINGICERNWRSILTMARSWMASALLPNSFWWFALKRATEVSNYIPIKVNGNLTTPHEIVYNQKPDLRNLLPMFCVAYTTYSSNHSYDSQTIRTILVGRSNKTNTYLFYHPKTKQLITSSRFKLDETLSTGPAFGLKYDGGLYFNKYMDPATQLTRPPTFSPETLAFIKTRSNKYQQIEIVTVPLIGDIYTVQYPDGSLHQHSEKDIFPTDPTLNPAHNDQPLDILPPWVQHESKCTLFLNGNSTPKHGYLVRDSNQWKFRPGHRKTNPTTTLENFDQQFHSLMNSHQLFRGHPSYKKLVQAKSSFILGKAIAKHVSAKGLSSHDVPTLVNHRRMKKQDKDIWDSAYAEEYFGLKNLPAWTTITESEYKTMQHKYKTLLPTMAISTIKFDEHNQPKRAKHRIVVLGNLDPHTWSKSDCYAPVMSLFELRLMTALSIRHKCILKNGDFKQAFVQAMLPKDENYVLKPPHGCPLTPPNTYWLLQRTLYGLKRSPRHWYDRAKQILLELGLKQCKHAPCLFHGRILPNEEPLYLGLYVDDFVYFSQSQKVEQHFETLLKSKTNVDFMGQVSHFLGIRFQWRTKDDHVHVHLSQEAFTENLVSQAGLNQISTKTNTTPYRSGCPVDALPKEYVPIHERTKLENTLRSYVGSLLWLSQGTRPDLATITNILAKYQNKPTRIIIDSAKYVIKYLKGTKNHGISFSSDSKRDITSSLHFPVDSNDADKIVGITDANWGPQDQSIPTQNSKPMELDLFKSRSISGHIIQLHGPLHWSSKRQRITARSSAEAEIYATDECVKDLIHLKHIITDLNLQNQLLNTKITVYNDNMACVLWSKNTTTKGIRHIQIRENGVRENAHLVDIRHVAGKLNPADLLSKEDKDIQHFVYFRDKLVPTPFEQ